MTVSVVLRTLSFPAPARLLSLNDRMHWAKAKKIKDAWRDATGWACVQDRAARQAQAAADRDGEAGDYLPPSILDFALPVKVNRRRDPHNFFPTLKVCVDALVTVGGWWPDDNSDWITVLEPSIVVGGGLVTITARARP